MKTAKENTLLFSENLIENRRFLQKGYAGDRTHCPKGNILYAAKFDKKRQAFILTFSSEICTLNFAHVGKK